MIINRIYETQKSSVAVACFLPGRAKDLAAPLYNETVKPLSMQGNQILTAHKGYGDRQLVELGNQTKLPPLPSPVSQHQISA